MAVYNNADYLKIQLQSLLNQTLDSFKIIIRDDCSTDHSVAIIEKFIDENPGKIYLIKGTQNLGAKGNFAELMQHSRADYIFFCDADDVWIPSKIEDSFCLMKKSEEQYGVNTPLLIHTDLSVVDKELHLIDSSFWDYSCLNPDAAFFLNRLLVQNVVTGCTMLINKPLLKLANPLPSEIIMHDWWLALVAAAFGQIAYIKKPTILYRQHGKNDTGAKNWKNKALYISRFQMSLSLKGKMELKKNFEKTVLQAAQFLNRYKNSLNPKQKEIIQDFVRLLSVNGLQRRYLFLKHRYFKNSILKNIGLFYIL